MKKIDLILKNQNVASIYLSNLAPSSRKTIRNSLNRIAQILGYENYEEVPWHEIRYGHAAAIRGRLIEKGYAAATINSHLVALRGVLREAWRLGELDAEVYHRAVDIKNVSGNSIRSGRALSNDEVQTIIKKCRSDRSNWGLRDSALFGVLRLGLRCDEVVKINICDIYNQELMVKGKGRKNRIIPIPNGINEDLMSWIKVRGVENDAMFVKIYHNYICNNKRLTKSGVRSIVKRRRKEAGVPHFTVHDWRRTFATDLLYNNVDVLTAQRLLGHANPITTARYDKRGEEVKKKAVELVDL